MQLANHDPNSNHAHTGAPTASIDASTTYVPGYDCYGPIHKGLRWALSSLLTRLGTCASDDAQAAQMALDDLEGVLYLFAGHAGHEDRHLHVALEARRAGSTASLGSAHERQERLIAELRALAAAFASASESAQPGLWRALYLRYAAFAGENLIHMSEEELEAQPLLETLYTRSEVAKIHQRLLAAVGPEERFAHMRAMILGATREERAALLAKVKASAPPAAVSALLNSVRGGLSAADFEDLAARM